MVLKTINPFTGETLHEYEEEPLDSIKKKIKSLRKEQVSWGQNLEKRLEAMREVRKRLEARSGELARLISIEMGKTLAQAEGEAGKCLEMMDYYIENATVMLQPEPVRTSASKSYIRFDPLGVILLIMPWNFPAWEVLRSAVPTLIAGNSILLKHASIVSGTSLMLQEIFDLPVFRSTVTRGNNALTVIKFVDGVSFTGSTSAGAQIAVESGRGLKKTVLQLGGSDPFIVLKSADLEKAVEASVKGRLYNNGQSCIASKRFVVHESIHDDFYEMMMEKFSRIKMGDPLDRETFLGPLSSAEQKKTVLAQIDALRLAGDVQQANVGVSGNFVTPTIVRSRSSFDQEVFGPVAIIKKFRTHEEAIKIANETPFGLGSSIWGNPDEAEKMVPAIQAGMVFINKIVTSDPRLPFGGVKKSGIGRELSRYGILEFSNIKAVWVE